MRRFVLSPALVFCGCFAIYMGWGSILLSAVAAAVCHEIGHVTALELMGVKICRVRIGFGGTVLETASMGYIQEIVCAFCGPLVNFVLFVLCVQTFFVFALCNLILMFYNLLPIFPLDGGRILRAVLFLWFEEDVAYRGLCCVKIVTLLLIFLGAIALMVRFRCGLWPLLVAAILVCKFRHSTCEEGY